MRVEAFANCSLQAEVTECPQLLPMLRWELGKIIRVCCDGDQPLQHVTSKPSLNASGSTLEACMSLDDRKRSFTFGVPCGWLP